jgi:hypothetical protein
LVYLAFANETARCATSRLAVNHLITTFSYDPNPISAAPMAGDQGVQFPVCEFVWDDARSQRGAVRTAMHGAGRMGTVLLQFSRMLSLS